MVKLKRKNKFTKEFKLKIKIKRIMTKLEEIKKSKLWIKWWNWKQIKIW